jgi:hypothetical protein
MSHPTLTARTARPVVFAATTSAGSAAKDKGVGVGVGAKRGSGPRVGSVVDSGVVVWIGNPIGDDAGVGETSAAAQAATKQAISRIVDHEAPTGRCMQPSVT